MAENQAGAGQAGQGNQVPTIQAPQAQIPAQVAPGVSLAAPQDKNEALRQKLTEILGDIIVKAQEVGFELATLDYAQLGRCPGLKPLVEKSRELVVSLKKLMELRKELPSA